MIGARSHTRALGAFVLGCSLLVGCRATSPAAVDSTATPEVDDLGIPLEPIELPCFHVQLPDLDVEQWDVDGSVGRIQLFDPEGLLTLGLTWNADHSEPPDDEGARRVASLARDRLATTTARMVDLEGPDRCGAGHTTGHRFALVMREPPHTRVLDTIWWCAEAGLLFTVYSSAMYPEDNAALDALHARVVDSLVCTGEPESADHRRGYRVLLPDDGWTQEYDQGTYREYFHGATATSFQIWSMPADGARGHFGGERCQPMLTDSLGEGLRKRRSEVTQSEVRDTDAGCVIEASGTAMIGEVEYALRAYQEIRDCGARWVITRSFTTEPLDPDPTRWWACGEAP